MLGQINGVRLMANAFASVTHSRLIINFSPHFAFMAFPVQRGEGKLMERIKHTGDACIL